MENSKTLHSCINYSKKFKGQLNICKSRQKRKLATKGILLLESTGLPWEYSGDPLKQDQVVERYREYKRHDPSIFYDHIQGEKWPSIFICVFKKHTLSNENSARSFGNCLPSKSHFDNVRTSLNRFIGAAVDLVAFVFHYNFSKASPLRILHFHDDITHTSTCKGNKPSWALASPPATGNLFQPPPAIWTQPAILCCPL